MTASNGIIPRNPSPATSPALATPPEEASPSSPTPPVGTVTGAPPSTPPLDMNAIQKMISEQVELQVEQRMSELGADPEREDFDGVAPFNQFLKKLEIFAENPDDPIPGYTLYWCNDEGDRIMRMQMMGYALVKRDEIALNSQVTPLNQDLGDYVAVYAGAKEGGHPLRTYLMKCPNEIYAKRKAYEQRHNDKIEESIQRGSVGDPGSSAYIPKATPIKYDPRNGRKVKVVSP